MPDSNISGEISRVSVDDIMRVVKETESGDNLFTV